MRRIVRMSLGFNRRSGHQHLQLALGIYTKLLHAMGKSEAEINQILNDLLGEYGMSLGG